MNKIELEKRSPSSQESSDDECYMCGHFEFEPTTHIRGPCVTNDEEELSWFISVKIPEFMDCLKYFLETNLEYTVPEDVGKSIESPDLCLSTRSSLKLLLIALNKFKLKGCDEIAPDLEEMLSVRLVYYLSDRKIVLTFL